MMLRELIEELENILEENDGKNMEVIVGEEDEHDGAYACYAYDVDSVKTQKIYRFYNDNGEKMCVIKMCHQIGQVDFREDE